MNLEEMKTRMAAQDARLEQVIQFNASLLLAKTAGGVRGLVPGLVVELLMAIAAAVWLGGFIAAHLTEPRFWMAAALLDLGAIALIGSCAWQLTVVGGLDYDQPVVTLQRELSRLRVLRLRTAQWTFALAFVAWLPLLLVVLKSWLGVDGWALLSNQWMAANVMFGLVVAWALNRVAHHYARQATLPPRIRSLADDMAGHSLTRALASLERIQRFEAGD